MSDRDTFHKAIGFNTYTVTTTKAIPITTVASDGTEATKATITCTGANVRMRWDGDADPTPTQGHFLGAGVERVLFGHSNLDQLRIIAVNATATVTVTLEAPE